MAGTHSSVLACDPLPADSVPTDSTQDSARAQIAARGGRVTRTRLAVLETLRARTHPLSHDELGDALAAIGVAHDRVTLYRALDWLVEQTLARRVAGGERAWRFEAVRDAAHRHAHFHCDRCGQVVCLEALEPTPAPALPAGYSLDRAELVLHGSCAQCGRNHTDEAHAR
jgi:Fur family transcriptional regulator, ferric uptake regulator